MQDPNPPPWGTQDRLQAHFIVRKQSPETLDFIARTVLNTSGYFGSKKGLWREVKMRRLMQYAEKQMGILQDGEASIDLLTESLEAYFRFLQHTPQLIRIMAWMFLEQDQDECMEIDKELIKAGVIRRLGVVVRHHEVGYGANAMVVWDVPDALMADAVNSLTSNTCVTLCYQRPRRLPEWPYNLFAMVHGTSEGAVRAQIAELRAEVPLSGLDHDVLFSRRRFKQTGACYRPNLDREVA